MRTPPRRRRHQICNAVTLILTSFILTALLLRHTLHPRLSIDVPARIAYFIQVSSTNLDLLPRLLLALYHPENVYAIHLDRKIPAHAVRDALLSVYRTVENRRGTDPAQNLHNLLIVRSEPITYRGITMTMNYLTGMNRLLEYGEWDFFINLSGADYPTASQSLMRVLLGRATGCNFVEWKPRSTWRGFAERRLGQFYIDTALGKLHGAESEYVDVNGRTVSKENNNNVHNPVWDAVDFTVAKSSGWFILTRRFCEHLLRDADARKIMVLMAFSDASDEHFVASVFWNGEGALRSSVVGSNLRSIFFVAPNGSFTIGEDGTRSRQHPFWVDQTDENGELLFWEELEKQPGFFTRKVRGESDGGGGFRDRVDREMIGLVRGDEEESERIQVLTRLRDYEERLRQRFEQLTNQTLQHRQNFEDE